MLTFLTGTYFSAKKNFIYERICSLLNEGEKVFLVVPEQAGFDRDRDFLFTYGEKLRHQLTVTSFSHLGRDYLEENGFREKPEADEAARNVLMSIAVSECAQELELFKRYSGKITLVSQLLAEYDEIKQAGLSTEDMKKSALTLPYGKLRKKITELSLIFSAYEALVGERFSERSNNTVMMTEFLKTHKVFKDAFVFFDDFRGFTGAQMKLMAEIISQSKESYVSVYAPESVNSYDSEAFLHAVRNCRKLRSLLSSRGISSGDKKIPFSHPDMAIDALSKSLFCAEKEKYEEKTESVKIITASDKYSECDTVALEIKKLLDEENYRCRDICITERDAGYAQSMISSLKKYGIPVFEDKRIPLFEYPVIKAVLCAVNIAAYGFTTEELFSYVKTGVTGIDTMQCALLENYVYIWGIDRGGWLKPFTGHPDGFGVEITKDAEEKLEEINAVREKIISPLLTLKRKLESGNAQTSCRAVYEFMVEINAAENFLSYAQFLYENKNEAGAVECSQVWDTLIHSLDALYDATNSEDITPVRFFELLKIIFSSSDIGRIPAGIDQIIIGSAGRTRHLEPKAVFVLGCNEGVFPAAPNAGGLFSSAERRILCKNEFPLENISENIYAEERMIAYSLLTLPTQRLYVSFSRTGADGQKTEASEIISEICTILPQVGFIDDRMISSEDRIGSPETAFEECAALYNENSVYCASLKKYVEESILSDRFKAVKSAAENLPAQMNDTAAANELFGRDMYISPSKAEVYHSCAFKYFCQYGLQIKKPRPADLDARINGLLIHDLLENILNPENSINIVEISEIELKAQINRFAEIFINNYMGGREDKGVLLNRSLDKSKDTAFEILRRMKAEFSLSRFETAAVELNISYKGKVKPYTLSLPDGGSITVGGMVDRVDIMKGDGKAYFRVVDYKTGGKDFKLSDVFDGLNMQMLIYLMCLWDNGKEQFGNIVPAGILYVPANNSGEQLERNATEEEVEAQKIHNGRMNGMILEDEQVLDGMEKGCNGYFINAYVDEKGRMKGTFLSMDGFVRLHKKIDEILKNMGQALHDGKIAALPVIGTSSYKYTCEYCDFKDICRRTENDASRELLGLSHKDAVEKLKGEEADG